jgi:hypothetical protein
LGSRLVCVDLPGNRHLSSIASAVRDMAETLKRDAPDPQIRAMVEEFAKAHLEMGTKYAAALQAFTQGRGLNSRDADKMVKGQDRAPTSVVDKIVNLLRERTNAERVSQKQALAAQFWTVSIVLLLAFGGIGIGSAVTIWNVSKSLRQTASELKESAAQVAAAAGQVASSSQSPRRRLYQLQRPRISGSRRHLLAAPNGLALRSYSDCARWCTARW